MNEEGGIRDLRGRVSFGPEFCDGLAAHPAKLDYGGEPPWNAAPPSAGRNGWMTPETLARHSDARSAEAVEAVARAIVGEEAAWDGVRRDDKLGDAWTAYQSHAVAAIAALRAHDEKWRRVSD